MPLRRTSLRFRRSLLAVLLLAVALAQTLGLMHGVIHGPRLAAAPALASVTQPAHHAVADSGAAHWLQQLFADHDRRDCRLYDQLSHADLAWCDVPALAPAEFVASPLAEPPGWQLAWQASGFLARGPPRLS